MKDLKHIRNRIHNRHGERYYNHRETYTRSSPSRFYRFIVTCMTLVVLALGAITFARTPLYTELEYKVATILPSLTKMVSTSFLAKFIPFEKWFPNKEELPVVASSLYEPGSQPGYFKSEGNQAISLYDGLIVYIGDDKGVKWIVVHHDNALYATYGNLDNVNVKLYDRIMQSDVLGTYSNEILLEFLYQNQDISYEEAKSIKED